MRIPVGWVLLCLSASLLALPAPSCWAQQRQQVTLTANNGQPVEDGLLWSNRSAGDGNATIVQIAGRWAFRTGPDVGPLALFNWFLYCNVDDGFILGDGMTPQTVWIQVDYLDQGTDKFTLEYDSTNRQGAGNGAYTSVGSPPVPVTKTNSGQWKTKIWMLTDANFANRENGGSDFRISDLGDGDEYLSRVIVSKSPLTLPNSTSISGKVADAMGQPLSGVQVTAGAEVATTDDQGHYALTLASSPVDVRVVLGGYVAATQSVTSQPGVPLTQDFKLQLDIRSQVSLSVHNGAPVERGLFWAQRTGGDGGATLVMDAGREAFRTGPDMGSAPQLYLYANVDDTFLSNGQPTREVWVTIDYLDRGADTFTLQYDAGPFPGSYKELPVITKTDSGQWMSMVFHITDASFANRENGGSDFRIFDEMDGPETIDRIIVSKTDPSLAPPIVPGDVNGDGKVSVADATLALRAALGIAMLTTDQQNAADANGDGRITVADATLILRLALGF